ncbi:V-type ATP synthase subunit B [candidate division KSB3 bacterium]|uniref:V-type ATP synthase beta chain n=1 Tax=candidate division KSB3 bacterium TaxID=2044937 RepID=A0A9D5JT58_9BACT|nr:V-type ATP synthase subunit B [candidate division KSB3 bacterium]MBD3323784.1 V-type ATP synthase subunit B [candidate division KSB3 bacterium]
MNLLTKQYQTVSQVIGPLIFVEAAKHVMYGAMVTIDPPEGERRSGQVIEVSDKYAVIQVFEETTGIDVDRTVITFAEEGARLGVSREMLGRTFDGSGTPLDGMPPLIPEDRLPISGDPINPVARRQPTDFIQTGISTIDCLNTLVRGQKLPIFSGAGLPANEVASLVVKNATVKEEREEFAIVFCGIGISHREAAFFLKSFEETVSRDRLVIFLNLASDPTVERLLAPRVALTAAEYLAFTHQMHVLVILTDMTNYCEALRQVATAREEIPGRRGYPGYMYTDLATIYERAGSIKDSRGTITQLPILTVPDDDITHPIADLTGYITEGQLVLDRELHRKGIFPPLDILPSLSRLMNQGIGPEKTRKDHRALADQLYASYARGRDVRRLVAIIGEEALSDLDRTALRFSETFEAQFVNQGAEDRPIASTLDLGWKLLSHFPQDELKRISLELLAEFYQEAEDGTE